MKTLILIVFLSTSIISFAQKVIKLEVDQAPEFGFSVSKQDTSIVRGGSVVLGTDFVVFGGSGEYHYSWSPAATLSDSCIINPLATPNDTTLYFLTVTDNFGCSFTLNYKVNVREKLVDAALNSNSKKLKAVLYPNPSNGTFKIKLSGAAAKQIEIALYDISGKIIKQQMIFDFTGEYIYSANLQLDSGVYSLFVESNTEKLTRQFIINQ